MRGPVPGPAVAPSRLRMILVGLWIVPGGPWLISGPALYAQERDPQAPVVQPGAPGESSRVLTPEDRSSTQTREHLPAEVRFMHQMIHHHAQALDMSELVAGRTSNPDIHLLAERIARAQGDEIALMQRWLRERGETAPDLEASVDEHAHGHPPTHDPRESMPGMLSADQMSSLRSADGAAFDRLFLDLMIVHHEGALEMVSELLAVPGAAHDTDTFRIASEIDADQRMEIARMRRTLSALTDS